jgi:hypothetical protein
MVLRTRRSTTILLKLLHISSFLQPQLSLLTINCKLFTLQPHFLLLQSQGTLPKLQLTLLSLLTLLLQSQIMLLLLKITLLLHMGQFQLTLQLCLIIHILWFNIMLLNTLRLLLHQLKRSQQLIVIKLLLLSKSHTILLNTTIIKQRKLKILLLHTHSFGHGRSIVFNRPLSRRYRDWLGQF